MTRRWTRRALSAIPVVVLVAGCAAAPLPSVRPLSHQSVKDLGWDSRTCAWTAQDASGYWPDLSPQENAIVEFFTYAPVRSGEWPRAITKPEEVGPVSPSPAYRGHGGRQTFEEVYGQCMTARGYELTSRAAEEKAR